MSTTLTDWRQKLRRVWVGCALAAAPALAWSANPPKGADTAPPAEGHDVDPATKKLTAANGLFQRGLYKYAGEAYKEFLDQNPKHEQVSAARYALAVCDYRQGDFAGAIAPLQAVLADPKFDQRDDALAVLGYCQLAGKEYEPATATFSELLTKHPQSKRAESAAIYRLQSLFLGGRQKEVAAAAKEFLDRYPKSTELPTALYFQSLSQRAAGQDDAAAVTLERLAKDFPESKYKFDGMLLLGQTLELQGKLDRAIEQYRALLAGAPQARKADAHYSLGLALYKSGAYAEAAGQLASVIEKFPSSPNVKPAKLQLGLALLAAGKTAEARKVLSAVAKEDAERSADAQYGLAQCDIADKKFDSARSALDALAQLQPPPANLPQILLDRAFCTMEAGKFEEAAGEFAAFETSYPASAQMSEALYRHAFSLHRVEKYEQSHALCDRVARLPSSVMTVPAAELDAENLFLMAKYADAQKAFAGLSQGTQDDARRSRYTLRQGQCEYFAGNYAKAAALLRPLMPAAGAKASDDSLQAQFLVGDALLQQGGQEAEAADVLKGYLAAAKGDQREARYKFALALAQSNDVAAALKALTPLMNGPAEDPWVQRALLESGQLNYKAKKPEAAASALNKLLAAKPLPELVDPATYLLGWVDFDAKNYADAAAKWQTVAEKSTNAKLGADAAFQRAVALKESGRTDEALAAAQAFAIAHPDKAEMARANQLAGSTLYDLAWQQRGKKDDAAAIETYGKLLKLAPDGKLAPAVRTEQADLLYNAKKYAEAAGLLENVLSDKSAEEKVTSVAMYRLAWCYEKLGKPDKAADLFIRYASTQAEDREMTPSALLEAGSASAEQGKFDQAEKSLVELLKRFPAYPQGNIALLKLGEARAEQQEFDTSLESYQQFLKKFPGSEFAYRAEFGIAWALENQKKYEEARKAYKKVIAASNGEFAARSQFQIGETLLAEQKFEPAIKELLAVEDVYAYPKWSALALFEAGRAFEQLKQADQAKAQYNQILTKYKESPEAALARERLKAI